MKASELISYMNILIEKHGDMQVVLSCEDSYQEVKELKKENFEFWSSSDPDKSLIAISI